MKIKKLNHRTHLLWEIGEAVKEAAETGYSIWKTADVAMYVLRRLEADPTVELKVDRRRRR